MLRFYIRTTLTLVLLVSGCGGKVVVDTSSEASGAGGGGGGGSGAGGGAGQSCPPAIDLPLDGAVAIEGPAPLSSPQAYDILRGLHAGSPEGERFEVQRAGHVVQVDAVLFADD